MDNSHFIRFLNKAEVTVKEISVALCITYHTARNRMLDLDFSYSELKKLAAFFKIPIIELINIIEGKPLEEINIVYALTKQDAIYKLKNDDDFLARILECYYIKSNSKRINPDKKDIEALKRYLNEKL